MGTNKRWEEREDGRVWEEIFSACNIHTYENLENSKFFWVCVCMHVLCVYMWAYVVKSACTSVCTWTWKLEVDISCPQSPHVLRQGLLLIMAPWFSHTSWLVVHKDPPASVSPVLRLQVRANMLSFFSLKCIYCICMNVWLANMNVNFVPVLGLQVLEEGIAHTWSYRWLWVPMWALETEPGSLLRVIRTFDLWPISPAPTLRFLFGAEIVNLHPHVLVLSTLLSEPTLQLLKNRNSLTGNLFL